MYNNYNEQVTDFISELGPGILLGLVLGILVFLFILLLGYVLFSYSIYTIAQRNKIENAWLSWIPIGQNYIMGLLIKEQTKIQKIEIWFVVAAIIMGFLGGIPVFGTVLMIGAGIFTLYCFHLFFKKYSPKHCITLTVINALTGTLAGAFLVFFLRNNKPQD